jgi:hypothetical protein
MQLYSRCRLPSLQDRALHTPRMTLDRLSPRQGTCRRRLTAKGPGQLPGARPAIVSKAAACCPLLTTIYLGGLEEPIEDAHLSKLASGCPRLRCVKLFRCKLITDVGIACLLKHCTALEELDILFCAGVSDTFREMIGVAYPHVRLVRLDLDDDGDAPAGRCRDFDNCHVHNSDAMAAERERQSALEARFPDLAELWPWREKKLRPNLRLADQQGAPLSGCGRQSACLPQCLRAPRCQCRRGLGLGRAQTRSSQQQPRRVWQAGPVMSRRLASARASPESPGHSSCDARASKIGAPASGRVQVQVPVDCGHWQLPEPIT